MSAGTNKIFVQAIAYMVIFIPCIIYGVIVNRYALNIPCMDDYDAILAFLTQYKQAHGIDRFWMLFMQHGEHRILSSRIVYALYQSVAGTINFRTIIFTGNLQLVILLAVLIHFIRRMLPRYWFWASFATAICLFDLNGWENETFAMASMQNYGIIMLCAVCLYLYSLPGKWAPLAAMLVQIIATYSSGNGILLSAVACLYTVFSGKRTSIMLSTATLLIFAPLYFVHYVNPITGHISHNILLIVSYFFYFLGCHTYYGSATLAIGTGVIFAVAFIIVLPVKKKLKINKEVMPLLFFSLFLLGSMGVATLYRCGLTGLAVPTRYYIYPNLLTAMLFIFILYKIKGHILALPVGITLTAVLGIVFNMNAYGGARNLAILNTTLKTKPYYYPADDPAREKAAEACRLNIYCIEKARSEK